MKQAIAIVGGYNALWPAYLGLTRELEDLSGLPAVGVPLMPWHWWGLVSEKEIAHLLDKIQQTVHWARRRWSAERFILVGHSAGGLLSRLYLSDRPFEGRIYAGHEHVSLLVTLGSPHCSLRGENSGWILTDKANELVPGATYAPTVSYRVVAGRFLQGNQHGSHRERRAFRSYSYLGKAGDLWGDGMVPVECACLPGVDPLVLEGVAHSRKVHRHWYGGSKAIVRRWWSDGIA